MVPPPERPLAALLGRGANYSGNLSFEGRVRVDGNYKGRIFTDDTLEVGEGGVVDGEVDVAILIVAGTVRGGIRVRDRLVLQPTGSLSGRVEAVHLEAHPGARIDAELKVGKG
jgi:cytoskeletal protein CcmA (bactofilin family)